MTSPAPRGTITRPSRSGQTRWSKDQFWNRLNTFLRNKTLIDNLTFENQGDKKKEIPGLRDNLLAEVRAHGEEDPETGSVFLGLEQPITIGTNVVRVVKAEARGYGKKHLDLDKAVEVLKAKTDEVNEGISEIDERADYVEDVTRYRVQLPLLTLDQYNRLQAALKKARMEDLIEDEVESLIAEDAILELHFDGDLTEDELDSMYEPDPVIWALTFQS